MYVQMRVSEKEKEREVGGNKRMEKEEMEEMENQVQFLFPAFQGVGGDQIRRPLLSVFEKPTHSATFL